MKHKHYDLIIAWADGARIERLEADGDWVETTTPYFSEGKEHRVMKVRKRINVEGWLNIYADGFASGLHKTKEEAERRGKAFASKTIFISEEIEVEE